MRWDFQADEGLPQNGRGLTAKRQGTHLLMLVDRLKSVVVLFSTASHVGDTKELVFARSKSFV